MRSTLFLGLALTGHFALAFGVVLTSGCGPAGAQRCGVGGRVTLDGQPVAEGTITFIPTGQTNGPSTGGAIKDGSYTVPRASGPVPGNYRVAIRAIRKTGRKIQAGPPSPPGTMIDEVKQVLPPKYNTGTTLSVAIQPGSNEHDFDLELQSTSTPP